MPVLFRSDRCFSPADVAVLFRKVGWYSADYPAQLTRSLRSTGVCITAWDQGRMVGLCAVLTDGAMTAYINYLLVLPCYREHGIGSRLLALAMNELKGYRRVILLADHGKEGFYRSFGFREENYSTGMAMFVRD